MRSPAATSTTRPGAFRELRDFEPMAWDFVLNFAKDNELKVSENKFEK